MNKLRIKTRTQQRPQAIWGTLVPAAINFVGGLISSSQQAKAQKKAIEAQQQLAQQQLDISNQNQLASTLNNYASAESSYKDNDYNLKYRAGGVKRLGSKRISITDGGSARRIGNNTFLLRGGSHEDINETGQTGIGINVGGNEIEAEGGEVAQRKGNSLRIFSAQPILNGISPAQAVAAGANKNAVFNAQQRFKRVNGLKDDGNKAKWGTQDYINAAKVVSSYLPVVGTLEDAYELYQHPSLEQAGWTALGAASDVFGGRAIVKGLKAARLASKAYKANKNILAARRMIDAKNYRNAQIMQGTVVPGADNVIQRNVVEPLKKRYGGRVKADLAIQDKGNFNPLNYVVTKGFSPLTKWVRSNRNNNIVASVLYESGLFDKYAYKNMLRDIHNLTGLGVDPDNPEQNQAVMTPAYTSSSTRVLSQLAKTAAEEPYIAKQVLGLPSTIATREAESAASVARRNYNIARMQAANAEARFDPLMNQVRYSNGQPIIVDTHGGYGSAKQISQAAHNMTSGTNPMAYAKAAKINVGKRAADFARRLGSNMRNGFEKDGSIRPWVWNTLIGAAGADVAAGYGAYKDRQANKAKAQAQLDANGKPISPYIARQDSTTQAQPKAQTKQTAPAAKAKATTKAQAVSDTIARRDTTSRDTTRNYAVSQYQKNDSISRASVAKPVAQKLYGLNNNETKTINGQVYVRKGNSVYNTTTKVRYDYANGKYTGNHKVYGVGDYSKVGKNFNEAFDAARAAGASQFKYNAGKYNQYTTKKETDAKKEALNRKVGAGRVAKRLGGNTIPPVGRRRYEWGDEANPWDKYKTPDYGGTAPWQISNKYDVTYPYAITDYDLPITTVTAKKKAANVNTTTPTKVVTQPAASSNIKTNTKVPYYGRQSSFKPTTQDYIGLGIDTLAALGSGMFTRAAYNNMNFDYKLPDYVDESPVAFDTIYHNEAQRANVERNRINSRYDIGNNTSSAQAALNRMQQVDTNALMETNKLLDEKSNKEVELRNQNAANEQAVRARNAAARNQYYQNVAQIKNSAIEAKNNVALAKAQSLSSDLSGLSQAWSNFAGSVENRYNTRQNEAIIAATSKEPAVLSNAIQFGYQFSPEVLAGIYNNTDNEQLKRLALTRLSNSDRRKYKIK